MRSVPFGWGAVAAAPVVALLAFIAIAAARPQVADAHPLGNFTINRYSRLELYSDVIRVRYVLDMAEIPTFQEMGAIDTDGDGQPGVEEKEAYLASAEPELLRNLHLTVNGSPVDLDLLSQELTFPPGQGGLVILRLSLLLQAPTSGSELAVDYRDENYADRIGWKEIVVRAADGVTLLESSAPAEDVSDELRTYPDDLLSSPLDVREASLSFRPGDAAPAPAVQAAASVSATETAPERPGRAFASLINTSNLTLPVVMLLLLAAFGFGALHAIEPGHGKTFVAAYFVGVKGTAKEAFLLGLIIAVTHSLGVLAIGLVTLYGSSFILPERLYPWLSLASGLLIIGLGIRLLATRLHGLRLWRRSADAQQDAHSHHGHSHADGSHSHHGHTHRLPEANSSAAPWRTLFALGLADGLVPSPSTLVVLLAAISLHRIGLGLLLIVAFSVGLASVLALVSLLLIYGRRLLEWLGTRRGKLSSYPPLSWLLSGVSPDGRLIRTVPLAGALALIVVGLMLTVRASLGGIVSLSSFL